MEVEIKFCGLTRPEDAEQVGALGGTYAGVIFAGGPRHLDAERAARVLAAVDGTVRRVGVFADQPPDEIARTVRDVGLHVVQLHGSPTPELIRRVRLQSEVEVWAVIRVAGGDLEERVESLDTEADGILLDALVPGQLGGTGVTFDWAAAASAARPRHARLIAAGGLTPENVAAAIHVLAPQVVDVSSGVELAPGLKDHERMRAFATAVHQAAHQSDLE